MFTAYYIYSMSQKNPPWYFFPNSWKFLVQILRTYYMFLSAPGCVSTDGEHFEHMMVVALNSLLHNFVNVADNWIKICSPA